MLETVKKKNHEGARAWRNWGRSMQQMAPMWVLWRKIGTTTTIAIDDEKS